MKKSHFVFQIVLFLVAVLDPLPVLAQAASDSESSCQAFEVLRADYMQSLSQDETGKPMASEQSVPLAWELIGAATDCLTGRDVAFERISTYALRILPGSGAEPGKTAALLQDMTDGAVIYDVGFFLRKPFAAGGFEQNILFLPHSAVSGEIDMVARHELNHARAHELWLDNDQRLRHLWIFGEDTMFVDEVLAYADGALQEDNAEKMKAWSLDMAYQYIAATRALLKNPNAEIATEMEGQRCPMTPALKEDVNAMLSCIEQVLQSDHPTAGEISACDGPRPQAEWCVHD